MKPIYIILVFLSLASAELEILNFDKIKNQNVSNINDLVDNYIPKIAEFIVSHNLDPLQLPSIERKLWLDVIEKAASVSKIVQLLKFVQPTIFHADLILHSGLLKHLSNLKRYGNATSSLKDDLLNLDINFEFEHLQGMYNFTIDLRFLNLKGRIVASAASVNAKINVSFNTTRPTLTLNKFELEFPSRISVIVENKKGLVDWINTAIINVITPFFKNTIVNTVQEKATNAIRTYFNELNKILI